MSACCRSLLDGADNAQAKKILERAGYTLVGGRLHYPDGKKEELQALN